MKPKLSTATLGCICYLLVVLGLELAAFLPSNPNVPAYIALFISTLPVSVIAVPTLELTIGFTFSANGGVTVRLLVVLLWMVFVCLQLGVLYEIRSMLRQKRAGLTPTLLHRDVQSSQRNGDDVSSHRRGRFRRGR